MRLKVISLETSNDAETLDIPAMNILLFILLAKIRFCPKSMDF